MKKFLAIIFSFLFASFAVATTLLIPVVNKPVTKEQAISLATSGGTELRIPKEELVKGLKFVIVKHGGHDTGADNAFSDEELLQAMKESTVVPCNFEKGEALVYGFRRNDPTKMDGFLRDSRPGEMCLSYKGARFISLSCMNPLLDNRPVRAKEEEKKKEEKGDGKKDAADKKTPLSVTTEWRATSVTRLTGNEVIVVQQPQSSGTFVSGWYGGVPWGGWGGWGNYGGPQGWGLTYSQSGPVQMVPPFVMQRWHSNNCQRC